MFVCVFCEAIFSFAAASGLISTCVGIFLFFWAGHVVSRNNSWLALVCVVAIGICSGCFCVSIKNEIFLSVFYQNYFSDNMANVVFFFFYTGKIPSKAAG